MRSYSQHFVFFIYYKWLNKRECFSPVSLYSLLLWNHLWVTCCEHDTSLLTLLERLPASKKTVWYNKRTSLLHDGVSYNHDAFYSEGPGSLSGGSHGRLPQVAGSVQSTSKLARLSENEKNAAFVKWTELNRLGQGEGQSALNFCHCSVVLILWKIIYSSLTMQRNKLDRLCLVIFFTHKPTWVELLVVPLSNDRFPILHANITLTKILARVKHSSLFPFNAINEE